jgi:Flp pilus assembly protein TadD
MLLSRYDGALDVFRRAAASFPKSAEVWYFVGISARGRGDFDVAEGALRSSLALKGDNVDALAQLGFVVGERGRDAEAERILRRALALDAKHFFASYDLGRLLVRARRYEEAITILRGAVTLRERDPGVHYQLFIAYSRLKRAADAERELALFRKLDEERKARRNEGGEERIEDTLPSPATSGP